MKTKTLDLINPFDVSAGPVSKLVLREPTGRDLMTIGEPYIQNRSAAGSMVVIENTDAIEAYISRCVVEPTGVNVIDRLGLADMMRVKDAVLSFFGDALSAGSAAAPTFSSSNSDGSMADGLGTQPSVNSTGGSIAA